jgi:putative transposase
LTGYQAFRYELDPTKRQRTNLARHAGCARFAYNWGLARRIELYRHGGLSTNAIELHRELNRLKPIEYRWMYDVSKCAPQEALRDLDAAYRRYFMAKGSRKSGFQRVGFPRFKKKGQARDSFRLTGLISASDRSVKLPRLGRLRTKESVFKLRGRITAATVSREADRWFVSLRVYVNVGNEAARSGPAVGIDLGITHFAVISDETDPVSGPSPLEAGIRKQRRLAKRLCRKQLGSANRRKAGLRLARHYRRVASVRRDFLHKLSTRLTKTKAIIVVESLNIAGMLKNRPLARRIADAGWGAFRRQLEYKSVRYGCRIIQAPLFFPSSKTCSACGGLKATLDLSERTFCCEHCGLSIDRDRNAAHNLARIVAVSSTETLTACGENVRPAVGRPLSLKQEPSGGLVSRVGLGERLNRRPSRPVEE